MSLREYYNTTHLDEQLAFDFSEVNKIINKDVLGVFESEPFL